MDTVIIDAKKRDTKKSSNSLRKAKIVPAVFYGKGIESLPLELDYQQIRKAYLKGGHSSIMDLNVDGKKFKVLIHDIQMDPLTGAINHVDFINVNLKEEITTEVPVEIVGVSPAIKDLGGVLTTVKHELEVKCLPMDLPHVIQVDISTLVDFSSSIHVKDIKVPKGVVLTDDADAVVLTVSAPRVEEEAAPAAEAAPAEGAAASAAATPEAKEEKKA